MILRESSVAALRRRLGQPIHQPGEAILVCLALFSPFVLSLGMKLTVIYFNGAQALKQSNGVQSGIAVDPRVTFKVLIGTVSLPSFSRLRKLKFQSFENPFSDQWENAPSRGCKLSK